MCKSPRARRRIAIAERRSARTRLRTASRRLSHRASGFRRPARRATQLARRRSHPPRRASRDAHPTGVLRAPHVVSRSPRIAGRSATNRTTLCRGRIARAARRRPLADERGRAARMSRFDSHATTDVHDETKEPSTATMLSRRGKFVVGRLANEVGPRGATVRRCVVRHHHATNRPSLPSRDSGRERFSAGHASAAVGDGANVRRSREDHDARRRDVHRFVTRPRCSCADGDARPMLCRCACLLVRATVRCDLAHTRMWITSRFAGLDDTQ